MPGGLMQLTAYGAQDFYLTGNPQISFFKAVYRRYTNFSMEMIEILPNVNVDLQENSDSSKLSFKISRNGDLVKDMYLVFTLPSIFSSVDKSFEWIKRIGEYIIKEVTITVGGKELDKQHGEYMHFYNELHLDEAQKDGYNKMIGNFNKFNNVAQAYSGYYPGSNAYIPSISERQIIVPLQFWFNKSFAQALPLIAMQYDSEPEITFTLRQFNQLYTVREGITVTLNLSVTDGESTTVTSDSGATNISNGMTVSAGNKFPGGTIVSEIIPSENFFNITFSNPVTNPGNSPFDITFTTSTSDLARNRPISADSNLGRFLSHNSSTDVTSLNINPRLEVNYIFLDKDERKRFASVEHEYLVKQVQFRTDIVTPTSDKKVHTMEIIKDIQHPVSTLIWAIRRSDHENVNMWSNYTNWPVESYDPLQTELASIGSYIFIDGNPFNNSDYTSSGTNGGTNYASLKHKNIMLDATLKLNGSDRFNTKSFEFFNYTNNYQHHKRIPTDGINVYTFSVGNNDNMQPSGTCNMSKFEANLQMTLAPRAYEDILGATPPTYNYNIYFYAVNYNVFRVLGGMANMEFSN
tara:strand:+ start:4231 stop:5964 length:1734 start_codon:yes stop_codon:yes gene_type:complete